MSRELFSLVNLGQAEHVSVEPCLQTVKFFYLSKFKNLLSPYSLHVEKLKIELFPDKLFRFYCEEFLLQKSQKKKKIQYHSVYSPVVTCFIFQDFKQFENKISGPPTNISTFSTGYSFRGGIHCIRATRRRVIWIFFVLTIRLKQEASIIKTKNG